MKNSDKLIWGIHGGKTGDADKLFLEKRFVALGWDEVGNLSDIKPDRESFKEKVAKSYPKFKLGKIANNGGQLYRFVHEMKTSDLVVYPSKRDRQVHIGEIISEYKYDPSFEKSYPNLRQVKWIKSLPRTSFTQGALYELGAALSFFQIKNYADEFLAKLERNIGIEKEPLVEDETVSLIAEDIEETTKDFILKKLAQELKGHPFSHFVGNLLETMGYRTRISEEGPDGGIDIIAHKDELGFEPPIIKVQVKSSEGKIGRPDVSALIGTLDKGEFGLIVTLGYFAPQAKDFVRNKSNVRLIDGDELIKLILFHYEDLDSRYKGLISLKKVYIPVTVEESK